MGAEGEGRIFAQLAKGLFMCITSGYGMGFEYEFLSGMSGFFSWIITW